MHSFYVNYMLYTQLYVINKEKLTEPYNYLLFSLFQSSQRFGLFLEEE